MTQHESRMNEIRRKIENYEETSQDSFFFAAQYLEFHYWNSTVEAFVCTHLTIIKTNNWIRKWLKRALFHAVYFHFSV